MMRNFNLIYPFIILVFFGACSVSKKSNGINTLTEIDVYSLPEFKTYLVSVKCERFKKMSDVTKQVIKQKRDLQKFYSLFCDFKNFTLDSTQTEVDSRMKIEFMDNNVVIKSICWSPISRIEMDGKVYSYNKEIEDYLFSKKLISKIITKSKF